jgi:hypothetical protein
MPDGAGDFARFVTANLAKSSSLRLRTAQRRRRRVVGLLGLSERVL